MYNRDTLRREKTSFRRYIRTRILSQETARAFVSMLETDLAVIKSSRRVRNFKHRLKRID